MGLTKNKKLFDIYVVKLIASKAVDKALEQKIKKKEIEKFLDEQFDNILEEAISKND